MKSARSREAPTPCARETRTHGNKREMLSRSAGSVFDEYRAQARSLSGGSIVELLNISATAPFCCCQDHRASPWDP